MLNMISSEKKKPPTSALLTGIHGLRILSIISIELFFDILIYFLIPFTLFSKKVLFLYMTCYCKFMVIKSHMVSAVTTVGKKSSTSG